MDLFRISANGLGSIYSDTVILDSYENEIVFFSAVAYNPLIQATVKQVSKAGSFVYVTNSGSYKCPRQGYNTSIKRESNSEYSHVVAYAKDKVEYREDGSELIRVYIYCKDESELVEKTYDKLVKYSSIPVLDEWKSYVCEKLIANRFLKKLSVKTNNNSFSSNCYKLICNKDSIKTIIQRGLKEKAINIKGSNNPSALMSEIKGLDAYLSTFGEILAHKIQTAFRPRFIPGEDKYDDFTNYLDDYVYDEANIEVFEAQKSVIQAITNSLKVHDSAFLIAEMGGGKTLMGASIPYVHHANRNKGYNSIVMCPSHLVNVWDREITERIPNAKAYIIRDYKELIDLEPKLRNKNKVENSYVIISKERAKLGYDVRPAAIWSRSKNTFVCPECGQPLYTKEYEGSGRHKRVVHVPFNETSMLKQLAYNKRCMNEIKKWNAKEGKYDVVHCNASLWTPLNKEDQDHKWLKLGSEGWIYKDHVVTLVNRLTSLESLTKKESALLAKLMEQYELIQAGEEPFSNYKGIRKYPIAKYIRERMNNVFDYCIVDECHEMKGLTEQGQAAADLISSSKKSILLTGTLLNGYADGLYYLLWRTVPRLMRKEGFKFSDEGEFARIYGVHSRESRFLMRNGLRQRRVGSIKEKRLPGVSPLAFTKFLLEYAVFLSLSDMSTGLPGYEEIPVPVAMDYELFNAYSQFEEAFTSYVRGRGSKKCMGPFLQNLSAYADCPHMVSPIVDPDTGDIVYTPVELPKQQRNKEDALLSLVEEKVRNGEKVLLYYSWVNKTDVGDSLLNLLKDNGITAFEMKSNVTSDKREEWIEKHIAKGMQVMICNPKLVETGLTLLDFTSIIFYQMGYNLFTMRQASRRSWRLSQTKDVKVYFMYYESSIQEQALSLMATKLQAAMALEGKFSEEGLRAMSNNEDLLTQIANNVVEGIKDTVNQEIFKATAFIKSDEVINREHLLPSYIFKTNFNELGEQSIFSKKSLQEIPDRKVVDVNEDFLKNPISLFL